MLTLTLGTDLGDGALESAVVAFEFVIALMVGERDGAVLALHGLAARAAEDDGRVAATVQQHHGLLAAGKALADGLRESAGKEHFLFFILLLEFETHIEDLDFGERTLLHPLAQLNQLILPLLCVVIGLKRRRR